MTLLRSDKFRSPSRSRVRATETRPLSAAQVERLLVLAEQLHGRPLPNVHVNEAEYLARYFHHELSSEWIDGEVVIMAPASGDHSLLNLWLSRLFSEFAEFHDAGNVYGPEFQMRLPAVRRRRNPNVLFVAKSNFPSIHKNHLEGPADVVVEIVSPDSVSRDWRDKYAEYESAGVREYWIVDPLSKTCEAHTLSRGKKYAPLAVDSKNRIHSKVLRGLYINPDWLWQTPLPKMATIAKELGLR